MKKRKITKRHIESVAVLDNNGICYNTSITNDVIGYVDADEVSNIMKQIQELPPVVQ